MKRPLKSNFSPACGGPTNLQSDCRNSKKSLNIILIFKLLSKLCILFEYQNCSSLLFEYYLNIKIMCARSALGKKSHIKIIFIKITPLFYFFLLIIIIILTCRGGDNNFISPVTVILIRFI